MIRIFLYSLLLVFFTLAAASADILVFVIDETSLGYADRPTSYANSPTSYANSHTSYANATSSYANSPSSYANSPSTYENGINGKRRIYNQDNDWLGYYTIPETGMVNLYSTSGKRVFYHPANKDTRGVFFADEARWAGIIGKKDGQFALGLTQQAYYYLLSNCR